MSGARVCSKRGGVVRGGLVTAGMVVMVCGLGSGVARANVVTVLARASEVAPTRGGTAAFSSFCNYSGYEPPIIGDNGVVAFRARLGGTGLTSATDTGLYVCSPNGSISCVGQEGYSIGSSGLIPAAFTGAQMASNGSIFFQATLTGTGVTTANAKSLWSYDAGRWTLAGREGSTYSSISEQLVARGDDELTCKALIGGLSTNFAYLWAGAGTWQEVVRVGGQPAQTVTGTAFGSSLRRVSASENYCLFTSNVTGGNSTAANDTGIWRYPIAVAGASPTLVCREGDAVSPANVGGAATISSVSGLNSLPVVNAAGVVAFTATYSGGASGTGVWRTAGSTRTLLARTGMQAPDCPSGQSFAGFSPTGLAQNATIGDDAVGTLALAATLAGPGVSPATDRGLWVFGSGAPRLLVRGGQSVADGLAILNASIGQLVTVNRHGDVAMRVQLAGEGVDSTNDGAILRYRQGRLSLVAREGQQFFSGGQTYYLRSVFGGPSIMFNSLGQVVMWAYVSTNSTEQAGNTCLLAIDESGRLRVVATLGLPLTLEGRNEQVTMNTFWASSTGALSRERPEVVLAAVLGSGRPGDEAVLRIRLDSCAADFNSSGDVSLQDLFDFLTAYFESDPVADVNNSGLVSPEDIFVFLASWHTGC